MVKSFSNGHALIIGVGADLPVTTADATALCNVLVDPQRAAYSMSHVELLTEHNANREEILLAFDRLSQRAANTVDSTVIVYYSGHGGRIVKGGKPTDYFLVPYGYDPMNRPATAISGAEFTSRIEAIRAEKLIVILDCCHAGGVPSVKDAEEIFVKAPVPTDLFKVLDSGSGRVIIASSREDEKSYTGEPYSAFTSCLLEALEGKGSSLKDGYARILDVIVYLFDQVPQRTSERQHPFVKKVLDLSDNFPLCFYAGDGKAVVGEPWMEPSEARSGPKAGRTQRLEQELEGLDSSWNLRAEKIGLLRNNLVIEAGTAVRFQLEKQLLNEEAELAKTNARMDEIEQVLQSYKLDTNET